LGLTACTEESYRDKSEMQKIVSRGRILTVTDC
jgi:hypothetical protein